MRTSLTRAITLLKMEQDILGKSRARGQATGRPPGEQKRGVVRVCGTGDAAPRRLGTRE
jgi:hypothetical protein